MDLRDIFTKQLILLFVFNLVPILVHAKIIVWQELLFHYFSHFRGIFVEGFSINEYNEDSLRFPFFLFALLLFYSKAFFDIFFSLVPNGAIVATHNEMFFPFGNAEDLVSDSSVDFSPFIFIKDE